MRLLTAILASCALAGWGCEAPRPPPAVSVMDSAGVRIVTSRAEVDRTFATVDPEPIVRLGGPDAGGAEAFFRIRGVRLDRQGRVWVADGQSQEIRIFEPDGSHGRTVGGRGEGPGEFLDVRFLGRLPGGAMVFWDRRTGRRTTFTEDGTLGEVTRYGRSDREIPHGYDVFDDGTMLAQFPTFVPAESLDPGSLLRDTTRLHRVDFEGRRADLVARSLGPTWLWTGREQLAIPFTMNPSFDVEEEAVHLVHGPGYRVKRFEDGVLTEIYGVDRPERPVDATAGSRYRSRFVDSLPAARREGRLEALNHPALPDLLPAYSRVLVDDAGRTWAALYTVTREDWVWDVYGPDGEWLGQVEVPERFHPYEIRGDRLVGVRWDELNVEQVWVLALRRTR